MSDGVYLQDIWNDTTIPPYTFAEAVSEAVDVLAYNYVEKNKGKKPSKELIDEWVARLMKDQNEQA